MEPPKWKVTELWIYPFKSCKGIPLQKARVGVHGMENDRRFMVVDAETGMFVAQRGDGNLGIGIKSMCLVTPTVTDEGLFQLSAPDMEPLREITSYTEERKVRVWNWEGYAHVCDTRSSHWFTEYLSRERPGNYQLVTLGGDLERRAKVGYSQLRFADGYPFLVITQESLNDLNRRIGADEPLPMNRFRPNIVISGGRPYDEDRIDRMLIGGVDFEGMELCVRCPITTTNQDTTERGKEPLKTLATYRRNPVIGKNGVVFGRNFNHLSTGNISVGGTVDFREYKEHGPCDGD